MIALIRRVKANQSGFLPALDVATCTRCSVSWSGTVKNLTVYYLVQPSEFQDSRSFGGWLTTIVLT